MYATLMAPCWAPGSAVRPAGNERAETWWQRIAAVQALLVEIAASPSVMDREKSIDIPAELFSERRIINATAALFRLQPTQDPGFALCSG
jgi:hypothetical protein